MKKKLIIAISVPLVLLVVAFAIFRIMERAPSADLPLDKRVSMIFDKGGCLDCHSAKAEKPFYADFPIIGDMEDYGFYCACNPEKMKEVLRGAWEGF
jgi:cytochrome c peroxidase